MKLRKFMESDWPRAADLLTSGEVARTYMLPDFPSREAARPLFDRLMQMSLEGKRYVRAMEDDGKFVGFLNEVEREGDAMEVGYAVCPDAWGRGHATAALKLAIAELFDLGLGRVIAGAFEGNNASLRVMEKAGMVCLDKSDEVEYRGKTYRCHYRVAEK